MRRKALALLTALMVSLGFTVAIVNAPVANAGHESCWPTDLATVDATRGKADQIGFR